jgi:hypothetical protein
MHLYISKQENSKIMCGILAIIGKGKDAELSKGLSKDVTSLMKVICMLWKTVLF